MRELIQWSASFCLTCWAALPKIFDTVFVQHMESQRSSMRRVSVCNYRKNVALSVNVVTTQHYKIEKNNKSHFIWWNVQWILHNEVTSDDDIIMIFVHDYKLCAWNQRVSWKHSQYQSSVFNCGKSPRRGIDQWPNVWLKITGGTRHPTWRLHCLATTTTTSHSSLSTKSYTSKIHNLQQWTLKWPLFHPGDSKWMCLRSLARRSVYLRHVPARYRTSHIKNYLTENECGYLAWHATMFLSATLLEVGYT